MKLVVRKKLISVLNLPTESENVVVLLQRNFPGSRQRKLSRDDKFEWVLFGVQAFVTLLQRVLRENSGLFEAQRFPAQLATDLAIF